MHPWQKLVRASILALVVAVASPGSVTAQTKPEGEMRFALYVTLAPAWLDPGEATPGFFTPFWLMYGVHDALVKPMPGNNMTPSLAEILDAKRRQARLRIHVAQGREVS